MHHAGLGDRWGQTAEIASGKPVRPSQTTMSTSPTRRFLISVSTCSQSLAPSPTRPRVTDGSPRPTARGYFGGPRR